HLLSFPTRRSSDLTALDEVGLPCLRQDRTHPRLRAGGGIRIPTQTPGPKLLARRIPHPKSPITTLHTSSSTSRSSRCKPWFSTALLWERSSWQQWRSPTQTEQILATSTHAT